MERQQGMLDRGQRMRPPPFFFSTRVTHAAAIGCFLVEARHNLPMAAWVARADGRGSHLRILALHPSYEFSRSTHP
ncbi:hypothetical protein, partial [Achromobacter denitrificans]|uniref:hypothetical protein n=1 Tax=Achromobacter denitrificans TaxID=32002 RepID=UPI0020CEC821